MGLIRVSEQNLKRESEQLKQYNDKFKRLIGELESIENSLNQMWDGDANDKFHEAFNRDKIQLNNFYNTMNTYVTTLVQVVSKYAQAEQRNVQIATERKY